MLDQNKIILMSKMASYEKRHMRRDKRITDYFVEDYVYMNNFITRLGISLITLFFMIMGAIKILMNELIFPLSIEQFIDVYVKAYIGPWVICIIVYTMISSVFYATKHKKATKRMNEYKRLVKELKKYDGQTKNNEEAIDEI